MILQYRTTENVVQTVYNTNTEVTVNQYACEFTCVNICVCLERDAEICREKWQKTNHATKQLKTKKQKTKKIIKEEK